MVTPPPRSTYLIFEWYLRCKMLILQKQKMICFLFSFQSALLKNIKKHIVFSHFFLYAYKKLQKTFSFYRFSTI